MLNIFESYREVIRYGYLRSVAEGKEVNAEIRFFISGDYLNFITYKGSQPPPGREELHRLIGSDEMLSQNMPAALETMKKKLRGITLLPKIFSSFLCVISSVIIYKNELLNLSGTIDSSEPGNLAKSVFLVLLIYIFFRFRYKIISFAIRTILKWVNFQEIIKRHFLPDKASL